MTHFDTYECVRFSLYIMRWQHAMWFEYALKLLLEEEETKSANLDNEARLFKADHEMAQLPIGLRLAK